MIMKKIAKEKAPVEIKEETPQVLSYKEDLKELKELLKEMNERLKRMTGG